MAASNNRSTEDDGINLYTTPHWATEALLDKEEFDGLIWEFCCGMGHISKVLESAGYDVQSTDLHDHGYGESGYNLFDYVDADVCNVVTNPPYDRHGTHFSALKHALAQPNVKKVAFFMPTQFLETVERAQWLETCGYFSKFYSFADRVKCLTCGSEDLSDNNTAKHFAWFVFDKSHDGSPAGICYLYKPDAQKQLEAEVRAERRIKLKAIKEAEDQKLQEETPSPIED